jgi:hypothetical protein
MYTSTGKECDEQNPAQKQLNNNANIPAVKVIVKDTAKVMEYA